MDRSPPAWLLLLAITACAPLAAPDAQPTVSHRSGARAPGVVRVVTWNIETVGAWDSAEYASALAILRRLDADVVSINEIADVWDESNAYDLADEAGYDWVVMGSQVFGADRNAIFSRLPLVAADALTADVISGDTRANDITRSFVTATVQTEAGPLDVVSMHWKSGWDDEDELRRVVESHRAAQLVHEDHPMVLAGDLNDDLRDGADVPARFDGLPWGMPSSFWVGADLWSRLRGEGLANDAFAPLLQAGLTILDARQRSGTDQTRPVSGRRLDYIAVNVRAEVAAFEVYNCRDEGLPGALVYAGDPVEGWRCGQAADHLPVVADLRMGHDSIAIEALAPGDLKITEVLPNPSACPDSTGEWIEIQNTTGSTVELDGLELRDASGHVGMVSGGRLAPGGLAVLGRGEAPCGAVFQGSYVDTVSLNNSGDTIEILGSTVLDGMAYSSAPAGLSWVRDGDRWCLGEPGPGSDDRPCD